MELPRVVILGGGNGTSHLLRSFLPMLHEKSISSLHALVHVSDDGGSTGRLREQYKVSSMGDLTRCMMALSSLKGDIRGEAWLKALDYRFEDGDFGGHTLRNIVLTSLELTSDIDSAIATMARVLMVPKFSGVIPTTLKPLTQQVFIDINGQTNLLGEGQYFIAHNVNLQADPDWKPGDVRVGFAEKKVGINLRALETLNKATHIVVAPGHTYGSILPTLASPALKDAIAKSSAHVSIVMTLLTTPRQTAGWSGEDFVSVYESYLGKGADFIISNTGRVSLNLEKGQDWVEFTGQDHKYNLIREDVVQTEAPGKQNGDTVPRAIVVHDAAKLEKIFRNTLLKTSK